MSVILKLGDCLEVMAKIPAASVDLILADLPYGSTQCKWDRVIPFEPLWERYRRVLKDHGAVVLTASQPFTSAVVTSNPKWFRHELIWDKVASTGFLDANRKPLKRHESILVFSPCRTTYNPIFASGVPYGTKTNGKTSVYGEFHATRTHNKGARYPTSIVVDSNANGIHRGKMHPTAKPVSLMEYLIRTHSNEGETVLDNTMGSGTTGVACVNTGRSFVGIEKDPDYFALARRRIRAAQAARRRQPA